LQSIAFSPYLSRPAGAPVSSAIRSPEALHRAHAWLRVMQRAAGQGDWRDPHEHWVENAESVRLICDQGSDCVTVCIRKDTGRSTWRCISIVRAVCVPRTNSGPHGHVILSLFVYGKGLLLSHFAAERVLPATGSFLNATSLLLWSASPSRSSPRRPAWSCRCSRHFFVGSRVGARQLRMPARRDLSLIAVEMKRPDGRRHLEVFGIPGKEGRQGLAYLGGFDDLMVLVDLLVVVGRAERQKVRDVYCASAPRFAVVDGLDLFARLRRSDFATGVSPCSLSSSLRVRGDPAGSGREKTIRAKPAQSRARQRMDSGS